MTASNKGRADVQLLEIAVSNVVAAPVGNSIELDAVRELHLVLLFKPAALVVSFGPSPGFAISGVVSSLDGRVVDELKLLSVVVAWQHGGCLVVVV